MRLLQRILNKLPRFHYDVWYNYQVYNREEYPIVFDEKGKYIECKKGVKLVMGKTKNGENIFYEITNYKYGRDGDFLYESDRIHCTMKFSHIETRKSNIA